MLPQRDNADFTACSRWKLDPESFTCHVCYMKAREGRMPEGYEGCNTIREVAARKEELESKLTQTLHTRSLSGQPSRSSSTTPNGSRHFSAYRSAWTLSGTPKAQEQTNQGASANFSERSKEEKRDATRRYQREWRARNGVNDPDWRVRKRSYERQYYYTDSEKRALVTKKERDRWHSDTEWRKHRLGVKRSERATPLFRESYLIYRWVLRKPKSRTFAAWQPYQPMVYHERVEQHCQGCDYVRNGGRKLWWKSGDTHNCHSCFMKRPDGGLPQDYKDCSNVKQLDAVLKQGKSGTFTGREPGTDKSKPEDDDTSPP
ncbi:hypothetical protein E4T43_00493 [Aureobasidium subglaciale]|nr:hypothetical protein E4T43_00493 [Aureobasidium subglaciale]